MSNGIKDFTKVRGNDEDKLIGGEEVGVVQYDNDYWNRNKPQDCVNGNRNRNARKWNICTGQAGTGNALAHLY